MGFGAFLGGVRNSDILNGNSYSGNVHERTGPVSIERS